MHDKVCRTCTNNQRTNSAFQGYYNDCYILLGSCRLIVADIKSGTNTIQRQKVTLSIAHVLRCLSFELYELRLQCGQSRLSTSRPKCRIQLVLVAAIAHGFIMCVCATLLPVFAPVCLYLFSPYLEK